MSDPTPTTLPSRERISNDLDTRDLDEYARNRAWWVLRAYSAGELHTTAEVEAVRQQALSEGRAEGVLMAKGVDVSDHDVLRMRWDEKATDAYVLFSMPNRQVRTILVPRPDPSQVSLAAERTRYYDAGVVTARNQIAEMIEDANRLTPSVHLAAMAACVRRIAEPPQSPPPHAVNIEAHTTLTADPPRESSRHAAWRRVRDAGGFSAGRFPVSPEPPYSDDPPPACTCPGDGFTVANDCPLHARRILAAEPGPPDGPPAEPDPDFDHMRKELDYGTDAPMRDLIGVVERLSRRVAADHAELSAMNEALGDYEEQQRKLHDRVADHHRRIAHLEIDRMDAALRPTRPPEAGR